MKLFLKWWLLISLTILGLGITYFNPLLSLFTQTTLQTHDCNFLTFYSNTIVIGYKVWRLLKCSSDQEKEKVNIVLKVNGI